MRKDATMFGVRARPGAVRIDPTPEASRSLYRIDLLCAGVGVTALVEHFRARAGYSNGPFLAMILPALCFLVWPAYRDRAMGWFRELWGRLDAFSNGSGRIPWMA